MDGGGLVVRSLVGGWWGGRFKKMQEVCSLLGHQNAATRRNMRREERVTVQGPVKEQQPDGMSHKGGGGCLPFSGRRVPSSLGTPPVGGMGCTSEFV